MERRLWERRAGERQAFGMSAFFKILAYFGLFGWNCADT